MDSLFLLAGNGGVNGFDNLTLWGGCTTLILDAYPIWSALTFPLPYPGSEDAQAYSIRLFWFRGGWVGEAKQICASIAHAPTHPPTLLTRGVKAHIEKLTSRLHMCNHYVSRLFKRYYTDLTWDFCGHTCITANTVVINRFKTWHLAFTDWGFKCTHFFCTCKNNTKNQKGAHNPNRTGRYPAHK